MSASDIAVRPLVAPDAAVKRPTIRDVAKLAGVSYGTVSRYLNGGRWVGADTAASIAEAITATGYTANRHARSLATGKSDSVAFLLTEPRHLLFDDPNFSVLLRHVAEELTARRIALLLMTASTTDERRDAIEFLSGNHVDGVLLVSTHAGDPFIADLIGAGIPAVACGRPIGFENAISSVAADDRGGAREAVTRLVGLGRRRIAHLGGPLDTSGGRDRLDGYLDALAAATGPARTPLVVHGDWTKARGRTAMAALLTETPDLDAVFVANDLMAAGALSALSDAARRVPEDVHVIGFDDAGRGGDLEPPLTSVHQPFGPIAHHMVRLLLDGDTGRGPTAVSVPTALTVRASSPDNNSPLTHQKGRHS